MCSELNATRIIKGYEKHKGKGNNIKKRNTNKESQYGSVNSELIFWRDISKLKNSIDLIDTDDLELSNNEIVEVFTRYSKSIPCRLEFNNNSQFLKLHNNKMIKRRD